MKPCSSCARPYDALRAVHGVVDSTTYSHAWRLAASCMQKASRIRLLGTCERAQVFGRLNSLEALETQFGCYTANVIKQDTHGHSDAGCGAGSPFTCSCSSQGVGAETPIELQLARASDASAVMS